MSVSIGIVGLPNVGKSTLFNTMTKSNVLAANYRFATIEPNIANVNLPDFRLKVLKEIYQTETIIPAVYQFVDIAGLIEGASKGEGLGNKFLQNIREVDAICHVVRCFDNKEVSHEYQTIDPIRDVEVINLELVISDFEIVDKYLIRIKKKADSGDKQAVFEFKALEKVHFALKNGKQAKEVLLDEKDLTFIKTLNLITLKPVLYIANINEDLVSCPEKSKNYLALKEYVEKHHELIIPISVKIENEISVLDEESKKLFMHDLRLKESGLDLVIKTAFRMLDLSTYFTCGKKEVHAWVFKNGMLAPECAGIIHTDFEKGFIKAEVISYTDLVFAGNEQKAKEIGKMRLEGKSYIMKDGDICNFKFNVTK